MLACVSIFFFRKIPISNPIGINGNKCFTKSLRRLINDEKGEDGREEEKGEKEEEEGREGEEEEVEEVEKEKEDGMGITLISAKSKDEANSKQFFITTK